MYSSRILLASPQVDWLAAVWVKGRKRADLAARFEDEIFPSFHGCMGTDAATALSLCFSFS